MHDNEHVGEETRRGVTTRTMEIVVAALLLLLALVVMYDSHRVGSGWADDGPQAGYFPFYVGLILAAASAWTLMRLLFAGKGDGHVFVTHRKLRLVLSVFIPSAIYVAAIYFIGIYVSSALFIGGFMYWHGRFSWPKIILVSVIVPVSMFLMFEVWFLVPLPKGPLEALIGY
jgi:putative tricarboxylic transport membrane protein